MSYVPSKNEKRVCGIVCFYQCNARLCLHIIYVDEDRLFPLFKTLQTKARVESSPSW